MGVCLKSGLPEGMGSAPYGSKMQGLHTELQHGQCVVQSWEFWCWMYLFLWQFGLDDMNGG